VALGPADDLGCGLGEHLLDGGPGRRVPHGPHERDRFAGGERHIEASYGRLVAEAGQTAEGLAGERVGQLGQHAVEHLGRDHVALFHRARPGSEALEPPAQEPGHGHGQLGTCVQRYGALDGSPSQWGVESSRSSRRLHKVEPNVSDHTHLCENSTPPGRPSLGQRSHNLRPPAEWASPTGTAFGWWACQRTVHLAPSVSASDTRAGEWPAPKVKGRRRDGLCKRNLPDLQNKEEKL
jgi:hypothetical protein